MERTQLQDFQRSKKTCDGNISIYDMALALTQEL